MLPKKKKKTPENNSQGKFLFVFFAHKTFKIKLRTFLLVPNIYPGPFLEKIIYFIL